MTDFQEQAVGGCSITQWSSAIYFALKKTFNFLLEQPAGITSDCQLTSWPALALIFAQTATLQPDQRVLKV